MVSDIQLATFSKLIGIIHLVSYCWGFGDCTILGAEREWHSAPPTSVITLLPMFSTFPWGTWLLPLPGRTISSWLTMWIISQGILIWCLESGITPVLVCPLRQTCDFSSQRGLDIILGAIVTMVSVPRLLLGRVATSKWLVFGDFSYINNDNDQGQWQGTVRPHQQAAGVHGVVQIQPEGHVPR